MVTLNKIWQMIEYTLRYGKQLHTLMTKGKVRDLIKTMAVSFLPNGYIRFSSLLLNKKREG